MKKIHLLNCRAGYFRQACSCPEFKSDCPEFQDPCLPAPRAAKEWIQSYAGRKVTPRALLPEQVDIESTAHALASKARFTGHTREPYSVAQHCVLGSRLLPVAFALPFLLHEVSEAYLPDVPAPLKPFVTVNVGTERPCVISWKELEAQHADVIFSALGLRSIRPLIDSPEVHAMDVAMLLAEKRDLMGPEPEPWGIPGEPALLLGPIHAWAWHVAEASFLAEYARLIAPGKVGRR